MATKNKIIKLISALLIISIITPAILFSKPKWVEALSVPGIGAGARGLPGLANMSVPIGVPVNDFIAQGLLGVTAVETTVDTVHTIKNWAVYLGKLLLRAAAKRLLAEMTQATINWINSDFHGAPLFLENPQSFFRNIAKSEVRNMVDMIGYDSLRYPFGGPVALQIMDSYRRQFATNAQYTLSKVIDDPDLLRRYQNDFDFGGWDGFLINTQYPQNNYLGFKMMVEDNLASRVQGTVMAPAERIKDILQQGMGFLSPQRCPSNPRYNNGFNEFQRPVFDDVKYEKEHPLPKQIYVDSSTSAEDLIKMQNENELWLEAKTNSKEEWAIKNTCPGGLVNTTPGSVVASQISNHLDSPRLMTALDGALGNSVAAIFDALFLHFFEKGLNALSDFINPPPGNDNWSYGDYDLGDDYSVGGDFKMPTDVSVRVGETTSIPIPAYYSVESQSNELAATAEIDVSSSSGNKLIVKGLKSEPNANTNIVKIQDSSDPTQIFTLTITVGEVGKLMVSPARILINDASSNNQVTATISGGEGQYFLQKGPDEDIAIAEVANNQLIVIGTHNGHTSLEIKDSSIPEKVVEVKIIIGSDYLIVDPSSIPITVNQTISATISGGTGHFVQPQSNESKAVAIAWVTSDDKFNVFGVAPGETTVTVQDLSDANKITDVVITVGNTGSLVVSPASIEIDANSQITADISGGKKPYSIIKKPDKITATAAISGNKLNKLTVAGIKSGTTSVKIEDSSEPTKKVVRVKIVVNPDYLTISAPLNVSDVSVDINETADITISIFGGATPYIIQPQSDASKAVATAEILPTNPTMLTIKGIAPGRTTVTVQDSSNPVRTADITIETLAR